jgi:acetyl-CoA carboxylase carboxyltransferase component
MTVQVPNGVVDVAGRDEAEAVARPSVPRYFQGRCRLGGRADQRAALVSRKPLRVYDVRGDRRVADTGSCSSLRRASGPAWSPRSRDRGRPVASSRNNPTHLAGADRRRRRRQGRALHAALRRVRPAVLFLCDTPGIMVGPEVEKTRARPPRGRLFVVGASLTVPFFTIVLRKGYGLGAQAMAGGSFKAPSSPWPGRPASSAAWASRAR